MAAERYADPLVTITDDGITVRHYYPIGGDKAVAWRDVESVTARTPTLWTGRWRMSGTGTFTTWFATDWGRPARETIFVMKLRTQSMKVGFTVHDAGRVKQILSARGVLRDEQGDAQPAPLPAETRPFWRWPALHAVLAVLLVLAGEIAYFHPRLPATVATHFNFYGNPDAWGPRATLSGAVAAAACLLGAGFLLIGFAVSRTPAALFGRFLLWFGAATLTLILAIAHFSFRANLTPAQSMGAAPLYALLAYLGVIAVWLVLMIRRLA